MADTLVRAYGSGMHVYSPKVNDNFEEYHVHRNVGTINISI
jgi:hypothetical protein